MKYQPWNRNQTRPTQSSTGFMSIIFGCLLVCILILLIWLAPAPAPAAEPHYNCTSPEGIAAMLHDNLDDDTIAAICKAVKE